ncbi:Y-family DNA polymerase [Luteithermobacter gelatinilyticus]|uniref:Y-family DNA polymerase n=1 Tax=Luteithermobacter gelatinilyticus TaxID=2582913 RepID=UPI0011060895|nr:impB/mucB/samB family protein [Luteithermobacter gelatinilyticus]
MRATLSDLPLLRNIPDHPRWLYLDLNSYFASVEQHLQPRLRGRPVAVVPIRDTDTTCAIAASYEAKALGIRTGTMIYEARKICPSLQIVPARHDRYVDYHHRILDEINRHLPITRVCSIDEVACRLPPTVQAPEAALTLARNIKRGIHDNVGESLKSSIGIGPNRLLAKIASNLQKPDGLTLLTKRDLPEKILHLSLRDLPGIGRNMERRLHRAGITNLQGLWDIAPKQARKIWGSVEGERFWYALHGVDLGEEMETTRRSVGHSHVLEPAMRPPERARLVARRLTTKAASRLRREGYYAGALSLYARYEGAGRWRSDLKFPAAQDNFTFLKALNKLWAEMIRQDRPKRLKHVAVSLFGLTPEQEIMPDLFDRLHDPLHTKQQRHIRLSQAMDKVNAKYGLDTVVLGSLPQPLARFTGTKIAFTRIPEREEFHE